MKKIFTMGGKFDARNYTVKDIIDQKGEKKNPVILHRAI